MFPTDQAHMEYALRLGRRNRGATAENPSVGCVVVARAGTGFRHVGQGWTQQGGRPHAETMALLQAGPRAKGATVYVTLEPCAHHGKTPPCTDALINAGVARVVAAIQDPDVRVAGKGLALLEQAGIEVDLGVAARVARLDLAGFLSRHERKRPYVTLKLAVSSDGKIAERPGLTTAITGEAARARGHLLRAQSDAILVGKTTVLSDDPLLTCRLPGLCGRSPVRVVLDSNLETPPDCALARSARDTGVIIYSVFQAGGSSNAALTDQGVIVVPVGTGEDGRPDLNAVLSDLAKRGINDLMVEGGARVAASFVDADRVDRVALFQSSGTIGSAGVDALHGMPLDRITGDAQFGHMSRHSVGEDMLDWYARKE